MLQEVVYPYGFIDDSEKFNETSLPEKSDFYSHLIMQDITDADYAYAKRVSNKTFSRISWFARLKRYIIVTFCIWELYKYVYWNIWPWSCSFSFWGRISMASSFKKIKAKIDLLTDIDMLLMVEKVITIFINMQKLITITWKTMIKIKNHQIFKIGM